MARLDEKQIAVARVYSRAMLDLAVSGGGAESLLEELKELMTLLEGQKDLDGFFSSPMIEPSERAKILEKLFRGRASDLLVDSLQVLNRNGRLAILPTVVEIFRQEYQERFDHIEVQVSSAVPLSEERRSEIVALASEMSGRRAVLVESVDGSLIGGMILRIGDRKIDTSVATQLRGLRMALEDRSALEIHRGIMEAGVA